MADARRHGWAMRHSSDIPMSGQDARAGAVDRRFPAWAGLLALGLCGAALVFFATPYGAGLGGDSYYYVSGARNLLAGLGFSRPAADGGIRLITHYPPGYSLVLAAMTGIGLDTLVAARWLSSALFGTNIFLIGFLVYRASRSVIPALGAALLALGSPALIVVHTWVLSEPLFLTFTLLSLIGLSVCAERGRAGDIAGAGLATALAYLTRYVGFVLIASGVSALLVFGTGDFKRRLVRAAGYGAISALGPIVWAVRNLAVSGSVAYSAQQLHPPSLDRLVEAGNTVSLWLLPSRVPFEIRLIAAGVVIALLIVAGARLFGPGAGETRRRAESVHIGVLACLIVFYPLTLVGALTLVGGSIPLDDRILSPLLVASIALAVLIAWSAYRQAGKSRVWRVGIALVALGFAAMTVVRAAGTVQRLHADGQGTAARAWRDSELVDWVRRLPEGVTLYSNELDVIYLYTGRQAFQVPIRWDPVLEAPRDDYAAQLSAMRDRLANQAAVLVLFDTIAAQSAFLPPREELTDGLLVVFQTSDGAAYSASPSARLTQGRAVVRIPTALDALGRGILE